MYCLKKWIVFWHLVFETICALAIRQPVIHTQPQYLAVSWHTPTVSPSKWNIAYSVPGTRYHSFLSLAGTSNSINISTTEYPGVLYSIKLFASSNGSSSLVGWGYARADCSNTAKVYVADTYQIESPSYPNSPVRGQICTWRVIGSNQTWYRINIDELDFGDGQSCDNYLQIEDKTLCDNGSFNDVLVLRNYSVDIKFVYGKDFGGKGFKINVTGIWKIEKPDNLTTVLSDDVILVTWQEPVDCPPDFFYVLRVSHYPYTSHADIVILGNTTSHQINATSHAGQNFTFQVKVANDELSGEFSNPVTIQTNCDENIYIRQLQTVTLTSQQFPFHYLAGVHCQYSIRTTDDHYIKVTVSTLDVDGGSDCTSAYLQIGQLGKFCSDSSPPVSTVIAASRLLLNFVTGEFVRGKGFKITFKSVEKPPSAPYNLVTRTEPGKILLHWTAPSSRSMYINGYIVQYSAGSNSASLTAPVNRNTTDIVIPTNDNNGMLFIFRVRATSEGGSSVYSKPHYARASCGSSFHLARLTSAFILSHQDERHKYQKGVVCRWSIITSSPLWLRVEFAKFDVEFSENCSKDYVELSNSNFGKVCGNNLTGVSQVLRQTQINVTFTTDNSNEFGGFILKITSVGPSPSKPTNVEIVPSEYSLIVFWELPTTHRHYLTGYLIHYRLFGNTTVFTERVLPHESHHVIDTTNTPGGLYEVWVQTHGDVEEGGSSDIVTSYAACGETITLQDERIYITSPHYPHKYSSNVRCQWNIFTTENVSVTVTFMDVDLKNTYNSCSDNVTISEFGVVCNDSAETTDNVWNNTTSVSVTFETDSSYEGRGFMLAVAKTYSIPIIPAASRRRLISGSLQLLPSPTEVLSISATSLVLTNILSSNTIFSSDDTIPVKTPLTLMPSFLPKMPLTTNLLKSAPVITPLKTETHSVSSYVLESSMIINGSVNLSLGNSSVTYHTHISGTDMLLPDSILDGPTPLSPLLNSPGTSESEVIKTPPEQHEPIDCSVFTCKHQSSLASSKVRTLYNRHSTSDEDTSDKSFSIVSIGADLVHNATQISGDTKQETKDHVEPFEASFSQSSIETTISHMNRIHFTNLNEVSRLTLSSAHNILNTSDTHEFKSVTGSFIINDGPFSEVLTNKSVLPVSAMTIKDENISVSAFVYGGSVNDRRAVGNATDKLMSRRLTGTLIIMMCLSVMASVM